VTRLTCRAGVLLLLILTAGWTGGGCAVAVDPQAIGDAQLAARVKTALVNDPELGGRPIEVRVVGGVAQLTGRVLSQDESARAQALARTVPGVLDVRSQLQVGTEPAPDDAGPRSRPGRDVDQDLLDLDAPPSLLAVGLGFSRTFPLDDLLDPRTGFGPMVKLGSGRGMGPVIGFGWFHADLPSSDGGGESVSRISVKPFMAGLGYTVGPDHVSITTSLVAGVAFNSLKIRDATGGPLAVDVGNSLVWRPNVTVWRNLSRRTVLNVSAGYVGTRLRVTFLEAGDTHVRRLSGGTAVVSTGVAYRIF
jgi:hypothetical protein